VPHAIWKGSISFGLVNIPVALYPGEKRDELNFVQLDRRDLSAIGYKKYNKRTGAEVPKEDIVRGYEYEEGRFVILTDDDLKNANPKATQTIEISDFVDAAEIPPTYFDRPYYLAPGPRGKKSYALLRETLKRTGKAGISTVVIHTKQYLAVVIPQGNLLVLDLLRYKPELREAGELELPGEDTLQEGVTDRELDMAEKLVGGMAEAWNPDKYRDTYRDDVLEMIDRKIKTGETRAAPEKEAEAVQAGAKGGAEIIDLMALLKKSVEKKESERAGAAPLPEDKKRAAG
jgi:DNA end-binding protein Ku